MVGSADYRKKTRGEVCKPIKSKLLNSMVKSVITLLDYSAQVTFSNVEMRFSSSQQTIESVSLISLIKIICISIGLGNSCQDSGLIFTKAFFFLCVCLKSKADVSVGKPAFSLFE